MKGIYLNAAALALALLTSLELADAARDAPLDASVVAADGADIAASPASSASEVDQSDRQKVAQASEGGLAGPPWSSQKVAKSLQRGLEAHLKCADWAVVMGPVGGGTTVTIQWVNKGYVFWNTLSGQPLDNYAFICRSIESTPALYAGMNARPVMYAASSEFLGAIFWRKKGDKPKLSEDEVREMVLAAADKCTAGDEFMKCAFDDIVTGDEAPLAGVCAMWPPTSVGFALSAPPEFGLVQVPYTYRLPGKPTPMVFVVQAM